jgi:hypothetical protein
MKARILIFLVYFFLGNTIEAHPIHISVTNLEISQDSGKIDYTVQLFYEDFQALINYKYNTMIDFSKQTRMTFKEQQSIIHYITGNFYLTDSDAVELHSEFLRWKIEDGSIWLFFCAKLNEGINELHIHNTLMVDLYNDQTNYMIYRAAEEEVGVEFNKRKVEHRFNL